MDTPPRSLLCSRVGRVLTRLANLVLRPIAERGWIGAHRHSAHGKVTKDLYIWAVVKLA